MLATRTPFERDGFAAYPDLADPSDIEEVRALLDPLFAKFGTLPDKYALDLAARDAGTPRIPDINRPLQLEPRLRGTNVFRHSRSLARHLLGAPVFCTFDHAICKPPQNAAATPWHQDQAYAGFPRAPKAVHIWIPLQTATKENGCMWFVTASHHQGLIPHSRVEGTRATLVASNVAESTAVCCPVALGGATVHTPLTLHMTGPNITLEPRKAWILHFTRFGKLGLLHPANLRQWIGRLNWRSAS